jgi:tetratricopeptide (TPR) repeat protein
VVKVASMTVIFQWSKRHWPLVIAIGCLLAAILQESRALATGYAAGLLFYGSLFTKKKWPAYLYWLAILLFVLLILALTFFVKTDSSAGRMLIYKISGNIFRDHFISGIGPGKFQLHYGLYQASYFGSDTFSTKELLLADNTYYAFNDYFQFIIETGIIGMLLVAGFFLIIITSLIKVAKARQSNPTLLLFACTQLIAIVCAAFFTHVFEKTAYQCLLFICLLLLLYYVTGRRISLKYCWVFIAGICLLLVLVDQKAWLTASKGMRQWKMANQFAKAGHRTAAFTAYSKAYPALQYLPAFLKEYSTFLIARENFSDAIPLLLKAIQYRTDNGSYTNLGLCYYKCGNMQLAEKYYTTAIHIVPNRFLPRYGLFNMYLETAQKEKAWQCGKEILTTPVKKPSIMVSHILNDVGEKINGYNH